MMVYEGMHSNA